MAESPPLVAPTQSLAPEAMINEGGAIAQPRGAPAKSSVLLNDSELQTVLAAFTVGLIAGWFIGHE